MKALCFLAPTIRFLKIAENTHFLENRKRAKISLLQIENGGFSSIKKKKKIKLAQRALLKKRGQNIDFSNSFELSSCQAGDPMYLLSNRDAPLASWGSRGCKAFKSKLGMLGC